MVEPVNFNDDMHITWRNTGRNHSLVERLTRVDAEPLLYEFTLTDPDTWAQPWSVELAMPRSRLPDLPVRASSPATAGRKPRASGKAAGRDGVTRTTASTVPGRTQRCRAALQPVSRSRTVRS